MKSVKAENVCLSDVFVTTPVSERTCKSQPEKRSALFEICADESVQSKSL